MPRRVGVKHKEATNIKLMNTPRRDWPSAQTLRIERYWRGMDGREVVAWVGAEALRRGIYC